MTLDCFNHTHGLLLSPKALLVDLLGDSARVLLCFQLFLSVVNTC